MTVTISKKKYKFFLENSIKYAYLEMYGVCKWSGYAKVMEKIKEDKVFLDEILEKEENEVQDEMHLWV